MSKRVRPKKSLGQHFLNDDNIARKIVNSLCRDITCDVPTKGKYTDVLEIGPGMGVLTKHLLEAGGWNLESGNHKYNLYLIEKDREAVEYLVKEFGVRSSEFKIIHGDFLKYDLNELGDGISEFGVIGNFPYNISTQILFKILEYRNRIPEVVGMFQKEVAQRIASDPNNKSYGILSVLVKAFYNIEYLFTVNETVFTPPPKVKSAVIRLVRNNKLSLDCNEDLFFEVVKTAFNQRRKMLRNALKPFGETVENIDSRILTKRAENLTVEDFVNITNIISH
jgi:16S rRNA (adenine1518-N6/adenine1519-N6)-dimethyltransferase